MNSHKLAIFDLDGTLHDSSAALTPSVEEALEEAGAPVPPGRDIEALYGQPLDFIASALVRDESLRDGFISALRRIQKEKVALRGRLFPGVREALADIASKGFRMAVCSNAGEGYIELVLGALGISGLFDLATGLGDRRSKSETLAVILASLGPRVAVMIGDRHLDFLAARDARIPSIGCAWGYGSREELRLADVVARRPGDLPGLVEMLTRVPV